MHIAHTGDNQADMLMKVFDELGLKGKIFAVVTDNASSAVRCVAKLIRKGYVSIHIRCTAHTLQLCVNDILKFADVADMLKRICCDSVGANYGTVALWWVDGRYGWVSGREVSYLISLSIPRAVVTCSGIGEQSGW